MGAAKRRGTFEQRKEKAIERDCRSELTKRQETKIKNEAMTPEEREQRHIDKINTASLLALSLEEVYMADFDNGRDMDEEQYEAKHGPSRRDRLRNDPDYGDWLYEQRKDKELEKEMGKEGKDD